MGFWFTSRRMRTPTDARSCQATHRGGGQVLATTPIACKYLPQVNQPQLEQAADVGGGHLGKAVILQVELAQACQACHASEWQALQLVGRDVQLFQGRKLVELFGQCAQSVPSQKELQVFGAALGGERTDSTDTLAHQRGRLGERDKRSSARGRGRQSSYAAQVNELADIGWQLGQLISLQVEDGEGGGKLPQGAADALDAIAAASRNRTGLATVAKGATVRRMSAPTRTP